jgi:hypothetical protein
MAIRFTIMRKHLFGIVFALIGSVVLYIPVDFAFGFLRNHPKNQGQTVRKEADAKSIRVPNPHFHHGLKSSFEQQDQWGSVQYPLISNSLGFKDRSPREVDLISPNYRILFIGDSFTEGIGYPHDLTFVRQVENKLAGQGVEVLNAGVVSYSPKLMFLKLDHLLRVEGLRLNEVAVFIDCSDAIDEIDYSKIRFEELKSQGLVPENSQSVELHKGPRHWYEYSLLYRTIARSVFRADPWKRITYANLATGREFAHYGQRSDWAHDQGLFDTWAKEGLESAAFYISKILQLGEEFGFRTSICVYPWPKEIGAAKKESLNVAFWRNYCKSHDAPLINLYPAFMDTKTPKEIVEKYFIPEDSHWNEAGHRYVAEQWMAQRNSNPPPLYPLPRKP